MSLNLFRRLDRYDRRIRQLERTEPEDGGGGGSMVLDDLTDVHAPAAFTNDDDYLTFDGSSGLWTSAPLETHDAAHADAFSAIDHTHTTHPDSDHDDRFALIAQGIPNGGTAGQVLTKDTGTDYDTSWQTGAAHADSDHDDRFSQLGHTHTGLPVEVAYVEQTSNVNVTVTTSATSILVVSAGAVTYTAVPHEVEFFCGYVVAPAVAGVAIYVGLYDGSAATGVARLGQVRTPSATAATGAPVYAKFRFTPSAGSHTYQARSYISAAGTGTISAGAGGSDLFAPVYIKVTRL